MVNLLGGEAATCSTGDVLVESGRCEVLEGRRHTVLSLLRRLVEGRRHHILLLLRLNYTAASVEVWLIEEGRLHRLEHVLVLAHHSVPCTFLLLVSLLLQAIVKDARCDVLAVLLMGLLTSVVLRSIVAMLGRNYLDITMVRQEFHIGWTVEQNLAGNGRQRIRQVAQFVLTVREAAILLELAHAGLHEVAADLRFVVRVHGADIVTPWVVIRHGLNKTRVIR